jgi:hypothetical protein
MEELTDLFHVVRSVETSCRMDNDQIDDYEKLNRLYNELSGTNVKHSICSKNVLLVKVEIFIECNQ